MDLSIICVNWNSVDYLRECVASVRQHTHDVSFEIIVVDNASPAGDAQALDQFADITLIKNDKNLGFAGANNLGFQRSSGNYILFLNPDTKLLSPAINTMLRHLQSLPNAGILGCKLLNGDLSVQTSCIMKFPTILNQLLQAESLRLRWPAFPLWAIAPLFSSSTEPTRVEAISGACMMMRREVFEKAGLFSEDYFMYAEDLDLCYKVARAGFENYYVGDASLVHYAGKSSPAEWQLIMKLQADLRFCAKLHGRFYGWLFRIALAFNAAARLVVIRVMSMLVGSTDAMCLSRDKWRIILKSLFTHSETSHALRHAPNQMPDSSTSHV